MSHFTVLIIGDDPEKQLEPFNEHIQVPEYEREEVSQEEKESFLNTYTEYVPDRGYGAKSEKEAKKNIKLLFKELYEKYGKDWNEESWKERTDGTWYEYSTYNPKSKWDWYLLGGRWTGFFKLKNKTTGTIGEPGIMTEPAEEGRVDAAFLKDIDINGMMQEEAKKAYKIFRKAKKLIAGESFKHWEDVRNMFKDDIKEAKKFYNNQPPIKRFNKSTDFGLFSNAEDFDMKEIDYVKKAEDATLSPFAVLKDGKWHEKGEMGWWACVTNEKDQTDWNIEVNKLINGLPGDTLISIYDCHI